MSYYETLKRLIDIVGAFLAIVFFSPIMVVTALYLKIISPDGPILADIPKRVGKDRKLFSMIKFRSMIPNADEVLKKDPVLYKKYQDNNYKLDPDPRILPGGKFLRLTSVDEIPQFFNIFRGDMSLVGPRAYYPFELEEQRKRFPQTAELIDKALTVKPGLTGVWQTSGRSNISFEHRVKMDADYASKHSILYDLYIIFKTPFVVLSRKGAY